MKYHKLRSRSNITFFLEQEENNLKETLSLFLLYYEVVHRTFPPHFFSVLVKFGACYITGQWKRVQNKIKYKINLTLTLTLNPNLLLFFIIKFMLLSLSLSFLSLSFLRLIYSLFFMKRKCQLDCMLLLVPK